MGGVESTTGFYNDRKVVRYEDGSVYYPNIREIPYYQRKEWNEALERMRMDKGTDHPDALDPVVNLLAYPPQHNNSNKIADASGFISSDFGAGEDSAASVRSHPKYQQQCDTESSIDSDTDSTVTSSSQRILRKRNAREYENDSHSHFFGSRFCPFFNRSRSKVTFKIPYFHSYMQRRKFNKNKIHTRLQSESESDDTESEPEADSDCNSEGKKTSNFGAKSKADSKTPSESFEMKSMDFQQAMPSTTTTSTKTTTAQHKS